jgi:DegV family protein with EDD domain
MNKYRIIVDSCVDFDEEMFNKNGSFYRVPFGLNIDDESILDVDLDSDELLEKMANSKGKIMSAAPSPQDFMQCFSASEANYVITVSAKLSGSYNAACLARTMFLDENKDAEIYIIDSKSAAAGEDILAYKLKLLLDDNTDTKKAYEEISKIRDDTETFFILEDFSVFVKNGRISNGKAFLIDLLNIVPIMTGDNGVIKTFKKCRGREKAFKVLVSTIGDRVVNKGKDVLMITYCAAKERALKIKKELSQLVPNLKVKLLQAGGLSTTYANKGGLIFAI